MLVLSTENNHHKPLNLARRVNVSFPVVSRSAHGYDKHVDDPGGHVRPLLFRPSSGGVCPRGDFHGSLWKSGNVLSERDRNDPPVL